MDGFIRVWNDCRRIVMPDDEKTKLLWWVIGAFITSIGVNQGIQKTTTVRHDPFTGAQGAVHESRIDSLELRIAGCDSKMRKYVDDEFKEEQKECSKYRREIEKRLSRAEWLQSQVVSTLRNRGLELDIRGPSE